MRSTVPLSLPASTYSPTRKASSAMKKMPETTSLTSVCEPKERARPSTPKPASSGAMLMPRAERMTRLVAAKMPPKMRLRMSGRMVESRL
ncbi:hypothetical protein D3C87_1840170 [compost metagenome]